MNSIKEQVILINEQVNCEAPGAIYFKNDLAVNVLEGRSALGQSHLPNVKFDF